MSAETRSPSELDNGMLIRGLFFGLVIGGVTALLTLPKSGRSLRKSVNEQLELAIPSDPVADSLAEGKAAARRRLESAQRQR